MNDPSESNLGDDLEPWEKLSRKVASHYGCSYLDALRVVMKNKDEIAKKASCFHGRLNPDDPIHSRAARVTLDPILLKGR